MEYLLRKFVIENANELDNIRQIRNKYEHEPFNYRSEIKIYAEKDYDNFIFLYVSITELKN